MNAAHETGSDRPALTMNAAQVFEAALSLQRIAPEDAVSTVSFLTRDPDTRGEGFVTIESLRELVATFLGELKEITCGHDAEKLILAATEVGPDYPHRTPNSDLVWACCVSATGPLCLHRLTPDERRILADKRDGMGLWIRRDPVDGDQYLSVLPSQIDRYLRRSRAIRFGKVSVTDTEVTVELIEARPRKTLVYRWEPVAAGQDARGSTPARVDPDYPHGPGTDDDHDGNRRAGPPV